MELRVAKVGPLDVQLLDWSDGRTRSIPGGEKPCGRERKDRYSACNSSRVPVGGFETDISAGGQVGTRRFIDVQLMELQASSSQLCDVQGLAVGAVAA